MKEYIAPQLTLVRLQYEGLLASSDGKLPDGHGSPSVGGSGVRAMEFDENSSDYWE